MVYKNLFYRILFSFFFFVIFFIALNNKYLLIILGTLIYIFVFYEVFKFFNKFLKLILIYLCSSYIFFIIYFYIFFDFIKFNIFVFTIILFDSFSFIIGKLFGNNYIFKFISPKKTLEGYLGGFVLTNFFFIGFFYFTNMYFEKKLLLLLINLIIFTSINGDLIESYFKRKNNIKDSSKYLPGHGGFFDRFDSFIASIIMLTLFSFFINL